MKFNSKFEVCVVVTAGYVYCMRRRRRLWSSELRASDDRGSSACASHRRQFEVIDDNSSMTKISQEFMQEATEGLLWLTIMLIRHIYISWTYRYIRTDNDGESLCDNASPRWSLAVIHRDRISHVYFSQISTQIHNVSNVNAV